MAYSTEWFVATGTPELRGAGRDGRARAAVGQARNGRQEGLRAPHPASADWNAARIRSGQLLQRPGVSASHGQGKQQSTINKQQTTNNTVALVHCCAHCFPFYPYYHIIIIIIIIIIFNIIITFGKM